MHEVIRLGIPKGSLNMNGRAQLPTSKLFEKAGYDVVGYEPGKEDESRLRIRNDLDIKITLIRPQSAVADLLDPEIKLDLAILGADWYLEKNGEQSAVELIGNLGYGKARLVVAIPMQSSQQTLTDFFRSQQERKTPVLCYTEYVNLTQRHFMKNPGYQEVYGEMAPRVRTRNHSFGDNYRVEIRESEGCTENYVGKGADLITDITEMIA